MTARTSSLGAGLLAQLSRPYRWLFTSTLLLLLALPVHSQSIGIAGDVTLLVRMVNFGGEFEATGPLPLTVPVPSNGNCAGSGTVTAMHSNAGIAVSIAGSLDTPGGTQCVLQWQFTVPLGNVEATLSTPSSPLAAIPVEFSLEIPSLSNASREQHRIYADNTSARRGNSEKVVILARHIDLEVGTPFNGETTLRSSASSLLRSNDTLTMRISQAQGTFWLDPPDAPASINQTTTYRVEPLPGAIPPSVATVGTWGLAILVVGMLVGVQLRSRSQGARAREG